MQDTDLLQLALGISSPWFVEQCTFDSERKQLDIYLIFRRGSEFTCFGCGREGCKAYDTIDKTWRHLNFFEHVTYLHARVPRTNCDQCGIGMVSVPWARNGSGFTLLFEAYLMMLAKDMPLKAIARSVKEHDTRLWRVLKHYVPKARDEQDFSQTTRVGMDETSSKKGHNYVSIFVDMDQSKVLFATEGKGAETVKAFSALKLNLCQKNKKMSFKAVGFAGEARFSRRLSEHGGDPEQITEVSCDKMKGNELR